MKNKKIIIISIILVIVILVGILLLPNQKNKNKSSKSKSFEDIVEKKLKDGTLEKELRKTIPESYNFTTKTKTTAKEMDIDSDNEKELVVYAEADINYLVILEVDTKNENIQAISGFGTESDKVIGYAYSIQDKNNYWFIYCNGSNDKFIIKDGVNQQTGEYDFINHYYVIEENIVNEFISFDLDKKEISKDKLKESNITNKEILERNNLVKEQLEEKASKSKQEEVKETTTNDNNDNTTNDNNNQNTNSITINGHTIPTNKKCNETANPLYDGFEIHSDGTCIIGNQECTWTHGKHDFAQDSSSAGTETECIIVSSSNGTNYFSTWSNNTISDGGIWECVY